MEFTKKIRTWKELDQAIKASGNRMFYVSFYVRGAALKMDNGRVITEKLSEAIAHLQES
jgi:hypothetical protein